MAITVVVRTGHGDDAPVCFDGVESVVVGRGASCDVRIPDTSVSHRHASLRLQGGHVVVIDEGSTNGTFVGGVRVASRTSRVVQPGETVRVGRIALDVRVEQVAATRDVAAATRGVAIAVLLAELRHKGAPLVARVEVVEGPDRGAALALDEEDRLYAIGRASTCALALGDVDASREHVHVLRAGGQVVLRDLGSKNGTWLGDGRMPDGGEVVWRPAQMARIGRTVLALREPVAEALTAAEEAPDEKIDEADIPLTPAPSEAEPTAPAESPSLDEPPPHATPRPSAANGRWTGTDLIVLAAAAGVLALSIAGLLWLLRS